MKKMVSYILLTTILILHLSGCGAAEDREETADSGIAPDASAVSDQGIRDNSLDAYSAAANAPLLLESPADAISGGGERAFLGASRAYRFKKHLGTL